MLGLGLLASACSGNKTASPPRPRADLAGTWQINRAASDSLEGRRRGDDDAGRGRTPGRGPGGGVGMPGGGRMPGSMGGMPGSGRDAMEAWNAIDAWTRNVDRITLVSDGDSVSVKYPDGATIRLATNGKAKKYAFRDFDDVESKAHWQDGALGLEHRIGKVRVTELFSRAPDSPRLIVVTRVLGGVRPFQLRRIYDKA